MLVLTRSFARLPAGLHASRRLASTYALYEVPEFPRPSDPLQPTKPFLDEERRRLGLEPPEQENSEEGRKRYQEYLDTLANVPPARPQAPVEVNPNHGLWAFFRKVQKNGEAQYEVLDRPAQQTLSGRGWRASELRRKSFKDLHTLWYVVLRERNLLATQRAEAARIGAVVDRLDIGHKDYECRKTMARIKQILNERRVAYEAAVNIQRETQAEALTPQDSEVISETQDIEDATEPRLRGRRRPHALAVTRANAWRLFAAKAGKGAEAGKETNEAAISEGEQNKGSSGDITIGDVPSIPPTASLLASETQAKP